MDIFIHNVIWLRQHYGLSKKKMAETLEISYWMLNKLEQGVFPPRLTIDILFRIYRVFGIRMADIVSVELNSEEGQALHLKLKQPFSSK